MKALQSWQGILVVVAVLSALGVIFAPAAGLSPFIGTFSPIAAALLAVISKLVRQKCSPVESMEEILIHVLSLGLILFAIALIMHGAACAPRSNVEFIVQTYFIGMIALCILIAFRFDTRKMMEMRK